MWAFYPFENLKTVKNCRNDLGLWLGYGLCTLPNENGLIAKRVEKVKMIWIQGTHIVFKTVNHFHTFHYFQ